ncbi:hypothetical protein RHMOL_Rhmol06G0211400 [Rhododendron molle]|uniref:Uncharacterized protein n=1 Tax=Rhododendron molle TaxID=49168 RepID=A0ACC0NGN1_RHOML|nr:hypothetical protein RHMOL_Rhmol06G0211400 [Rhododendron molle]
MDSLVRNTTLRFSRRTHAIPKQKSDDQRPNMTVSLSFRRERAKKRQIFLRTYNLASSDNYDCSQKSSRCLKLKKFGVKVKSVVCSAMLLARFRLSRCCYSPPAISPFPSPDRKYF